MICVQYLRTARFAFAISALLLCTLRAPPAFADASTWCIYDILLEAHAMASRCGETLDAAGEQRFNALVAAARRSMVENSARTGKSPAELGALLDKMEVQEKAHYDDRDLAFCKTSEYRDGVFMLKSLTSEKGYPGIMKSLQTRRNPEEGDCL